MGGGEYGKAKDVNTYLFYKWKESRKAVPKPIIIVLSLYRSL